MKLVFTKQETKDMVMQHIATKLGIDVNDKELDLNFKEYNSREYCSIDVTDKDPPEEIMKAESTPDETINLDELDSIFPDDPKPAEEVK